MSDLKPVLKLENPSLGSRKDKILTDEMMVAFCESRIDLLNKEIKDCVESALKLQESLLTEFTRLLGLHPVHVGSKYAIDEVRFPFKVRANYSTEVIQVEYDSIYIKIDLAPKRTDWGNDFSVKLPFIGELFGDKEEYVGWLNSTHEIDYASMQISSKSTISLSELDDIIDLRDWIFNNPELFEWIVDFLEHSESDFFDQITRLKALVRECQEERNVMRWKRQLAYNRALQSRALDIIEFGYVGDYQKLFRKRDLPVLVKELQVLRITPSLKTVDIRIKGRDWKCYEYGRYGIWRTGVQYKEESEWIEKGVRVSTLFEIDLIDNYSEEACPYDYTIRYRRELY